VCFTGTERYFECRDNDTIQVSEEQMFKNIYILASTAVELGYAWSEQVAAARTPCLKSRSRPWPRGTSKQGPQLPGLHAAQTAHHNREALSPFTAHSSWKVKVHTLDIAPLRSESPPQKRSGMARVLKGSHHSFTCTPTRSSAIGMSHTCLCLPKGKGSI